MSLTYGFYNSQSGDRIYSTSQISDFLDGLITDGIFAMINDGTNHGFQVREMSTPAMGVLVSQGKAWLNSTWTKIDSAYEVTLSSSTLLPRIDAIVLTINKTRSSRSNYIEVIEGTPASSPEKPTVEDETNIYRYVLAWVTVGASVTSITDSAIESNINVTDGIPFVDLADPLGGTYPTTEELLAQYKAQFDDWFDYMKDQLTTDAAGALQTEIDTRDDNLADEYDSTESYSSGDFSMNSGVLKKYDGSTWSDTQVCDEIISMKETFQDGVDTIYNAIVNQGVTPSSSTPSDCATGIATVATNKYNAGVSATKVGTATAAQVLSGYTFTNSSSVGASGSMTNRGAYTATGTPTGNNTVNVTIPAGYHNGSGYITADGTTSYSVGFLAGAAISSGYVRITYLSGTYIIGSGTTLQVYKSSASSVTISTTGSIKDGSTMCTIKLLRSSGAPISTTTVTDAGATISLSDTNIGSVLIQGDSSYSYNISIVFS